MRIYGDMRLYVHAPTSTYDETAIQVRTSGGEIAEFRNGHGWTRMPSPSPLDLMDDSTIPSRPFWEEVVEEAARPQEGEGE